MLRTPLEIFASENNDAKKKKEKVKTWDFCLRGKTNGGGKKKKVTWELCL